MLRAVLLISSCAAVIAFAAQRQDVGDTFAVIVSSSRYWFNYRHNADALAMYHAVRRLGLPDTRIILMLADNPACSPHNPTPGRVYARKNDRMHGDVFSEDTQVDYSGAAVTADALLRVLSGHHRPGTPQSRRLAMGPRSRLLLYLTGHGGDGFLKFHDREELAAEDLATALSLAEAAERFSEALVVLDTCQAATLTEPLRTVAGDAKPTWRQALQRPENSEDTGGPLRDSGRRSQGFSEGCWRCCPSELPRYARMLGLSPSAAASVAKTALRQALMRPSACLWQTSSAS